MYIRNYGDLLKGLIKFLLALLLVFSSVAYGCVETWSQAVAFSLIFLAFLFWLIRMQITKNIVFLRAGPDVSLLLFFVVALLSFSVSVYPYATKVALFELLSFVALLYLIINVLDEEREIFLMVYLLLGIAALISIIGILRSLNSTGIIASIWKYSAFSTFTNTSHFSAYIGMFIPISIALLFCEINPNGKLWIVFAFFLMMMALILSFDKGGIAQIVVAFFALFLFLGFSGLIRHKGERILFASVVILIAIFSLINASEIPHTFSVIFTSDFGSSSDPTLWKRWLLWQDTIEMIKTRPLFGYGLGTFQFVYPRFQNPRLISLFESARFAHQEYLQIAAETGILGLGAFLWFLYAFFKIAIRSMRLQRKSVLQGIIVGGVASCCGVLAHNFYEFNFHIETITITFVVIVALVLKSSFLVRYRADIENMRSALQISRPNSKVAVGIFLALFVVTVYSGIFFARHLLSSIYYAKGKELYERLEFSWAIDELEKSLTFNPRNILVLTTLANIYAIRSQINLQSADENFNKARRLYERVLEVNTLSSETHLRLARLYSAHNQKNLALEEFGKAATCEPNNPLYISALADFYLLLGERKKACQLYQKALLLDPRDEYVRRRLKELY